MNTVVTDMRAETRVDDDSQAACVAYRPGWLDDHERRLAELVGAIAWRQPTVTVYGRRHPTPRLQAWFGVGSYTYSGVESPAAPFPSALEQIRRRLAGDGITVNSCLANLYRDGHDTVGWHSDDERGLGPEPTIASVSLGARRRFVLRHNASGRKYEWSLGGGDLLVMFGESQSDYRHSVPRTARPVGTRVNLTFRTVAP